MSRDKLLLQLPYVFFHIDLLILLGFWYPQTAKVEDASM